MFSHSLRNKPSESFLEDERDREIQGERQRQRHRETETEREKETDRLRTAFPRQDNQENILSHDISFVDSSDMFSIMSDSIIKSIFSNSSALLSCDNL